MGRELEKTYHPAGMEDRLYGEWEKQGYFHAEPKEGKEPYCIVIPPPNITGQLHMGHALDNTLQDILIRWKRMEGKEALWQPGTDHASIATEVKIVQKMAEEGLDKETLGRDGFMERAWEWKEEYGGVIIDQLKKLGASCDWERERFTLDQGCSDAVLEVFIRYYEKGYIYRGSKMINWCPVCQTTISDAEVEHVEKNSHFYHLRYKIAGEEGYLELATTRPETLLGDTAVAVNPGDERYAALVGKKVVLPIVNKEIPIIADDYVDREFGTGVVKITPAHDPNDFEVGLRHNLPQVNVINDDGTINAMGGEYEGLDRYEARKRMVARLKEEGNLVKIEDHVHNVGLHDRCDTVVEPLVKQQWFVRMDELAKPAIQALKSGELQFVPERYGKIYLHWLENIRDWCISRQLWWGHRIPAYYCQECGEIVVSKEMPQACPKCGASRWKQDEDSLDTWFSSALWPFSTLGWPEATKEMEYFFPTNVLVTGYDIIFFWVVRMVFSSLEFTGKVPFKTVFIHGLVRDADGRKMSKSLGNGIDPLEVIGQYGADALRLALVTGNSPGNDMRFNLEKIESSRNFANKIWNASRFILMNLGDEEPEEVSLESLTPADKWILSKANNLAKEVTDNMDRFELGLAVAKLYDFIWDEFCDWYIEMVKPRLYQGEGETREAALWTLKTVLVQSLKLLHPYMPFVTEEIFKTIQSQETSIMVSYWPGFRPEWDFAKEEAEITLLKEAVRSVRNVRADMQVPPSRKAKVHVVSEDADIRRIFREGTVFFASLASASEVEIQEDRTGIDEDAVSTMIPQAAIYMPLAELVDMEKEVARLEKEAGKLRQEVERVSKKLANQGFTSKAPAQVIQEEKDKQAKYEQVLEQVSARLEQLKKKLK
ncbi:valine--tRNA ligase [Anaerotalea alkaliphila]|uniref:Valine--tRNA ligase n=1 Tax=Anaerotalea alkaliphila TaxID=2662126 RepID=A0A7X5HX05_9FIRM|nr:valine--tRNA ligase [Anaerotalea alkaliphila]NDL68200.1 valine--tRNA ligase [Anaerotalea alkaliphila]